MVSGSSSVPRPLEKAILNCANDFVNKGGLNTANGVVLVPIGGEVMAILETVDST